MKEQNLDEIIAKVVKEAGIAVARTPRKLTLSLANALIEKVQEKAKSMNMRVVTAVVDAGGNPIAVQCMDDAYIASYDIALNKAFTSVSLKMSTKTLASLAGPGGSLYGIQHTNNGRIVIFGGGVPLRDKGEIIGGFGVSGGSAKEDTELGDYAESIFKTLL
ncbi:MAG: heme-binding protein [Lachnospiraceae bacterium]|nr:heme-binding protein [Lachnospiraceae bacterium]